MKLSVIDRNVPCYLLKWKSITIMLDTPLPIHLPFFMPHSDSWQVLSSESDHEPDTKRQKLDQTEQSHSHSIPTVQKGKETLFNIPPCFNLPRGASLPPFLTADWSCVDCILVSNYENMLALPFWLEKMQYKPRVYATEPTVAFGRLMMLELAQLTHEMNPNIYDSIRMKLKNHGVHAVPASLAHLFQEMGPFWQSCYSKEQVEQTIQCIQPVRFNEELSLLNRLDAIAVSSGYCLGSANWIIQTSFQKFVYVSQSSSPVMYSGRHPAALDARRLKLADVMLLSGIAPQVPPAPDGMLNELCNAMVATVSKGGSVLLPISCSGLVYDLIHIIHQHLQRTTLRQIPMFMLGPVASASLKHAQILAEWMSPAYQQRVQIPDWPLPMGDLVAQGKIKAFEGLHVKAFQESLKMPCIIWLNDRWLRSADAVTLMNWWRDEKRHSIMFTDANISVQQILAPFQPLAMRVAHFQMDTRLTVEQANDLLQEWQPKQLICNASFSDQFKVDSKIVSFSGQTLLDIKLKSKFERAWMNEELTSKSCNMNETTKQGWVQVSISTKDYKFDCDESEFHEPMDTYSILQKLLEKEFPQALLRREEQRIILEWHDLRITSIADVIHIETSNTETRKRVHQFLGSFL